MGRRRRGVMSEKLKEELAKDLGFYETVKKEGWGSIRAKDAGNMVKRALQIAEQTLARQSRNQQSTQPSRPMQGTRQPAPFAPQLIPEQPQNPMWQRQHPPSGPFQAGQPFPPQMPSSMDEYQPRQ